MDPLEQKIRKAFEQITFGEDGGNILSNQVVHSLEIDKDLAKIVLIIPEKHKNIKAKTTQHIEETLKSFKEITNVSTRIVTSLDEIAKENTPSPRDKVQPQKQNYLKEYDNVILVASGKGGVGKSTVAINLALALQKLGKKVSLLDADVYGPSIPIMLGRRNEPLKIEANRLKPMNQFGINFLSVGSMIEEDQAAILRGPMVHQIIQHILRDTAWPGGEYIIVDLPPGTGDVQLSLVQMTENPGVVIVCTPQDVALMDARKAIAMFVKMNIPILGMIENMSSFVCPKCGAETPIFAKGGTERESDLQKISFIGRIPIEMDIRVSSDCGDPIVHAMPNSAVAVNFGLMAEKLDKIIHEMD